MKYCCTNSARQGSCYFEFQKGRFLGEFWQDDSLYLSDDIFEALGLYHVFVEILPFFDHYGINEITKEQWRHLTRAAGKRGGAVKEAVEEIDCWFQSDLGDVTVLTVLGI